MRVGAIMTECRDTGCNFSPRCVDCPLAACKWETPLKDSLLPRDLAMLAMFNRGRTYAEIGELYQIAYKHIAMGLQRARRYHQFVSVSAGGAVSNDGVKKGLALSVGAEHAPPTPLDPRIRLHLASPKPKRKTRIRTRDWHNRLLILRAWGYSLSQIGYAADRLDHTSVLHHLREDCKCGQTGAWAGYRRKVDVGREEAA